jgi:hypothetical protein
MKIHFLFLIAFLTIFISCKKGQPDYVKGTVTEGYSNAPIAGAKVTLYKYSKSKKNEEVRSVMTNNNGEYEIEYTKIPNTSYTVKTELYNYTNYEDGLGKDIETGKQAINFILFPAAYLKVRFNKISNVSESVHCKLNGVYFTAPWAGSLTQPFDSTRSEIYKVYTGKANILEWGTFQPFSADQLQPFPNTEQVYVPKGDTLVYTITFN